MEINGVLNSQISDTNFSQGRFQFRFLEDGNAVLNPRDVPSNFAYDTYYSSNTHDSTNSSNSGHQLVFNQIGHLFIVRRNGQISNLSNQMATLSPEPICECPLGYSLVDPNDKYGNCKLSFVQSCDENGPNLGKDLYALEELNNTDWPFSDYERKNPFSEEDCRNSCLTDCFCAVAIHNGDDCWKKRLPLSNGRRESSVNRTAFLKFMKGDFPQKGPGLRKKQGTVIIVKQIRVVQEAEKEFQAEVNVIAHTHHKNLVRLLGFCDDGENRLLVYEYMSNGTLASFLFGVSKPNWNLRTRIAMGIARGLLYIHEECTTQIIHCDIKPQNVLLDDCYNSRISDFGVAKLLMVDQSQIYTTIRGTKGYIAPEWFRNKPITVKVDVYSFGLLHLEIISCRKSLEGLSVEGGEIHILTDWVWDCFQEGKLVALVENDIEALNDMKILERFVMVGIWCIQEDPILRPSMWKVTQMLEGVVEVTPRVGPSPFLL
ncbi:hypothetical protein LguiA_021998 [Lonicera macranthoides]